MSFFYPHLFPPLWIPQAGMTDWQVAGGQWSSDPSLPGTGPIVHTGPRHSWLPHVFSLEPCRWLDGLYQPPWRHDNGRGAASPTHTFLVNAFLRPCGVSRGQHHSLTQPIHPPFPLAHRTSRLQSGPGALAQAALWDLPRYGAWDVGSDLRVWAGPERGGGVLGRPRLWLQIMLHYVWTQGVWKHCGPQRLSS